MDRKDVIGWRDRETPSLAVDAARNIVYLDNAAPGYGSPMYNVRHHRYGFVCWAQTFDQACGHIARVNDYYAAGDRSDRHAHEAR